MSSNRSNYRGSTLSNNSRQDMNRSRSSHRNSNDEYNGYRRTTSYDRSYSNRNSKRTFEDNNNRKKYGEIEDEYVDCKAILDNEKNLKYKNDSKYNRSTSNKGKLLFEKIHNNNNHYYKRIIMFIIFRLH